MNTKTATLAGAIAAGRVRNIPGLAERMERHEREVEEIESKPWLKAEIKRVVGELEATLRQDIDQLIVEVRRDRLRDLDQREGTLRAKARALGFDADDRAVRAQVARSTRAQLLAAQADRAIAPADVNAVWQEALLSDDPDTVRLVGASARRRLHEIAAADAGKDVSALRDAALLFDAQFSSWRRDHPSTVEELSEIERQRAVEETLFNASVQHALRIYGIAEMAPEPQLREVPDVEPSASGLRIGPGFDQHGAGHKLALGDPSARR